MEITKEGYETQVIQISAMPSGWYLLGNLVFGSLTGWLIVDPLTEAMWTLRPDDINSELQRSSFINDSKNNEDVSIILKEQIPENVFENLNLVKIN